MNKEKVEKNARFVIKQDESIEGVEDIKTLVAKMSAED